MTSLKLKLLSPNSPEPTMKSNKQLAQLVAERLTDEVFEEMMERIADITSDVMQEEGLDPSSDKGYDDLLDISSRLYIGAQ
jgi:hypothetical protein